MTNFYQINAQSDHMIYWLIERIAIIDHHDNNQSVNQLNHNQFTALICIVVWEKFDVKNFLLLVWHDKNWMHEIFLTMNKK